MPPPKSPQAQRINKIKAVTKSVKEHWPKGSFNDFLLAFYTSDDAAVSQHAAMTLRYDEGKDYSPAKILDAWFDRAPSQASKEQLNKIIMKKAADIAIKESTKACKSKDLQVASADIDIDRLTSNTALHQIKNVYQAVLPCLWLFLFAILTADNNYEKKKRVQKKNKEQIAERVRTRRPSTAPLKLIYMQLGRLLS